MSHLIMSRIKLFTPVITGALFTVFIIAASFSCVRNSPPVIESLIAWPDTVCPGDTATISCIFSDADDEDNLLFTWHIPSGQRVSDASAPEGSIRWIAPDEPGTYPIGLTISDSESYAKDSVWVEVIREMGSFTDLRDGHRYSWVTIGDQTWMAENLAFLPEVYPPAEGGYQEPFYYVQGYAGHDATLAAAHENYGKYGVLYNWKAMQSACPAGWHPCSDEDWITLEQYLGMSSSEAEESGDRLSGAVGRKLKLLSGWMEDGSGTNQSGFGALPGGSRNSNGEFGSIGMRANFRTTTAGGSSFNFARSLNYDSDGIRRGTASHNIGFSVRCVKN